MTLRDLEADLFLPLLFLGLGGGVLLLVEGLGEGVLGGDLGALGLFLLEVESLQETV